MLTETSRKVRGNLFLISIVISYIVLISLFSIIRHYNLCSFAYDLGIFMQSLWSTFHNKPFYETPDLYWNSSGNFLSIHFSLLLLILLPIYFLFPFAESLLIFQTILIGFSAIPLYMLARRVSNDDLFPKILVLSYFLSPALQSANFYDFHMEAFLPVLFISSIYFLEKNDIAKSVVFVILPVFAIYTLSPLVILTLIAYLLNPKIGRKMRFFLIFVMILVSIYFFIVALIILPLMGTPPFKPGTISWFPFLGRSWSEIFLSIVLSPMNVVKSVSYDLSLKLVYWLLLSLPVSFLFLLYPRMLIPLSYWLIISFLTSYTPFYTIGWQYPFITLPFIYCGSAYGFRKIKNRRGLFKKIILIFSLCQVLLSPLGPLRHLIINYLGGSGYDINLTIPPRSFSLQELFHSLEDDAILATSNVFPHLANRLNTYIWLPEYVVPKYIILDVRNIARLNYIVKDARFLDQVKKLWLNYKYGVYALKEGVLFLKRDYVGDPIVNEPFEVEISFSHLNLAQKFRSKTPEFLVPILPEAIKNMRTPARYQFCIMIVPGYYVLELKINSEYLEKTYISFSSYLYNEIIIKKIYLSDFSLIDYSEDGWVILKHSFNADTFYFDITIEGWNIDQHREILDYIRLYGPL